MTPHRLRAAGLVLVVAVGVSGCGDDDAALPDQRTVTAAPGDGPATPGEEAPGTASGSGDPASPSPAASSTSGVPGDATPTSPAPSSPDPGETLPSSTPASDQGAVGGNGRAILRPDRATLVIEVDAQEGASVSQAALDHLVAQLAGIVDKPGGIVFRGGNTFADPRTAWSGDDLRAAVAANRSTATTDDEVSVHVLYVRGGHVEGGQETSAIGVAYSASTVALFPERWGGLGSLLGQDVAVERAVLVHELGHLLGLVNLTYTSPIDHEDPEHPGHSTNRDSVMFHAVESTLIGQVFGGAPPDTFDEADRADLAGLRDGSL